MEIAKIMVFKCVYEKKQGLDALHRSLPVHEYRDKNSIALFVRVSVSVFECL